MSVYLLRKTSDVPNITNRVDARAMRYAYGADGIIKDYGNELDLDTSASAKIKSGILVLQGWEIEVDQGGVPIEINSLSGKQYYTAYAELNLETETAVFKTTYNSNSYPEVTAGDDLTTYPSGTARIATHHFIVEQGLITSSEKLVNVINYNDEDITNIKNGLTTYELIWQGNSSTVSSFEKPIHNGEILRIFLNKGTDSEVVEVKVGEETKFNRLSYHLIAGSSFTEILSFVMHTVEAKENQIKTSNYVKAIELADTVKYYPEPPTENVFNIKQILRVNYKIKG